MNRFDLIASRRTRVIRPLVLIWPVCTDDSSTMADLDAVLVSPFSSFECI